MAGMTVNLHSPSDALLERLEDLLELLAPPTHEVFQSGSPKRCSWALHPNLR